MNFFRKKLIIKYMNILEKEDVKNIFKTIPNNFPKYFSTIPKTMFNSKTKKFIPYLKTIKSCPGFINLYKRSILVTSPFDIYIEFDDNQIVDARAGQTKFKIANTHDNEQFLNYISSNEYKFIIKVNLPFFIDSNVSLYMSQSTYHFNNFDVLPGIIPKSYERNLNFFIPIEKRRNELYIKKDTPLFLITPLCEKNIKLKFKKLEVNAIKPSLTFSTLKERILKNLI